MKNIIPLYFGDKFIGTVPLMDGKKSVFSYIDKNRKYGKVYWNKKFDKYGNLYYKVYFKDTK
jgi:hypothetical protein